MNPEVAIPRAATTLSSAHSPGLELVVEYACVRALACVSVRPPGFSPRPGAS